LVGGNIQSCPIGVWVNRGCCSVYNTGFQISSTFDIVVNNTANDTMVVSGVRSESSNFIQLHNGITAHIVGCSHLASSNGVFADVGGSAVIESCVSWHGIVRGSGAIRTSNSCFGRSDWVDVSSMRADGVHEVHNSYVGGTHNIGFANATFIPHKIMTVSGSRWLSSRQVIPLKPGTAVSTIPIVAGTRIQKVSLIVDTPGQSGVVSVGDGNEPRRYFGAAALTGITLVSARTEQRYATADTLYVDCTDAVGVAGFVAVDFIIES
jgi:hypothetical protein